MAAAHEAKWGSFSCAYRNGQQDAVHLPIRDVLEMASDLLPDVFAQIPEGSYKNWIIAVLQNAEKKMYPFDPRLRSVWSVLDQFNSNNEVLYLKHCSAAFSCMMLKNYVAANQLYDQAAIINRKAYYYLAVMYLESMGYPQDFTTIIQFLKLAADCGHPGAQFYLGYCHGNRKGVSLNLAESVKWLTLAADQGHPGALSYLANYYENDIDGGKNLEKVQKLRAKAVEQGYQRSWIPKDHSSLDLDFVGTNIIDPGVKRHNSRIMACTIL